MTEMLKGPGRRSGEEHGYTDPEKVLVQLNVKVPWHYREQLSRIAYDERMSLNRLVVNALVRQIPPERT